MLQDKCVATVSLVAAARNWPVAFAQTKHCYGPLATLFRVGPTQIPYGSSTYGVVALTLTNCDRFAPRRGDGRGLDCTRSLSEINRL